MRRERKEISMSNSNTATLDVTFKPGQVLIFTPDTKNRGFSAPAGTEVTVGPQGVYFAGERRYVEIIWPHSVTQGNGGYYVHDFVVKTEAVAQAAPKAEPKRPAEPSAPMTKAVLELMRRKGAITQMEAQGVLRCRALPRRIADLKVLGHRITREMKMDPTGQRYARYHLHKAA
ncbi:hypothetical protein CN074_25195 [Sinorhizobium medicae]|nr:hypothetical protein CN201_28910 [Sinorhizobium medicae]RVP63892.1 hypothetical protein CN074_25195 [Sinorhizobium medicae]